MAAVKQSPPDGTPTDGAPAPDSATRELSPARAALPQPIARPAPQETEELAAEHFDLSRLAPQEIAAELARRSRTGQAQMTAAPGQQGPPRQRQTAQPEPFAAMSYAISPAIAERQRLKDQYAAERYHNDLAQNGPFLGAAGLPVHHSSAARPTADPIPAAAIPATTPATTPATIPATTPATTIASGLPAAVPDAGFDIARRAAVWQAKNMRLARTPPSATTATMPDEVAATVVAPPDAAVADRGLSASTAVPATDMGLTIRQRPTGLSAATPRFSPPAADHAITERRAADRRVADRRARAGSLPERADERPGRKDPSVAAQAAADPSFRRRADCGPWVPSLSEASLVDPPRADPPRDDPPRDDPPRDDPPRADPPRDDPPRADPSQTQRRLLELRAPETNFRPLWPRPARRLRWEQRIAALLIFAALLGGPVIYFYPWLSALQGQVRRELTDAMAVFNHLTGIDLGTQPGSDPATGPGANNAGDNPAGGASGQAATQPAPAGTRVVSAVTTGAISKPKARPAVPMTTLSGSTATLVKPLPAATRQPMPADLDINTAVNTPRVNAATAASQPAVAAASPDPIQPRVIGQQMTQQRASVTASPAAAPTAIATVPASPAWLKPQPFDPAFDPVKAAPAADKTPATISPDAGLKARPYDPGVLMAPSD